MKQEPVIKDNNKLSDKNAFEDPGGSYKKYWEGKAYESEAEAMAVGRFLKNMHFRNAVDIGGGYGKLSVLLENYADEVTLTEPNQQRLDVAKIYLNGHPSIKCEVMNPSKLNFKNSSIDLITMVRVMHHIHDPSPEFAEIARVLTKEGFAIIEVANYTHAHNRIKYFLKREKPPAKAVNVKEKLRQNSSLNFVNHNPHTVVKQLAHEGLKVDRILSVSNLRSPALKRMVPKRVMLAIEGILQPTLASSFFGPSVFFLVRKI